MKKNKIFVINKNGSVYPKKLKFFGRVIKLDIDTTTH